MLFIVWRLLDCLFFFLFKIFFFFYLANFNEDTEISHSLSCCAIGVIMVLAWGVCMALSFFIARFGKNMIGEKWVYVIYYYFIIILFHFYIIFILLLLFISFFLSSVNIMISFIVQHHFT